MFLQLNPSGGNHSLAKFPNYDDLPVVDGMPQGCAWSVFNKNGKKDVYGCLNKITPDIMRAAAQEVRDGVSISLNWPIGAMKTPGYYRKGLVHKVMSFVDTPLHIHGYDDEFEFNSQCSSQWDSFCHFYHQESAVAYNGVNPSVTDLIQDFGDEDKDQCLPTLNHWHERGGVVSRGVLIDYKSYAEANGIQYRPYDSHIITISEIETIARNQGVEFRQGDVFLLRTGYTEALTGASAEEQDEIIRTNKAVGVEGTMKAVKWFWDIHCSAVACDTVGFEVCPAVPPEGSDDSGSTGLVLHPHFLSLLGIPIGELWDLKTLSEYCAKKKRYTFMLTSVPLNIAGAVGSPPNALAIF